MELYLDDGCLSNDESCFYVKTFYNGKSISINACMDERSFDGTTCNYLSFISHFYEVMTKGNLDNACYVPFVPTRIN
jgi:hypothetical protein